MEHRQLIEELGLAAARFKIESDPAKRQLYGLAAENYDPQGGGLGHGKE